MIDHNKVNPVDDCICFNCWAFRRSMWKKEGPDCGCEQAPFYNSEMCGQCRYRDRCEIFLHPELYRACRVCGCTDLDCSQCIEVQGFPCYWVSDDLCSRCAKEVICMDGVTRIAAERKRQIEVEGWTVVHDEQHEGGELALAACCYASPVKLYVEERFEGGPAFFDPFPDWWDGKWDKRFSYGERKNNPGNMVPDPGTYTFKERLDLLVKAGALIAAEIDRLLLIEKEKNNGGSDDGK